MPTDIDPRDVDPRKLTIEELDALDQRVRRELHRRKKDDGWLLIDPAGIEYVAKPSGAFVPPEGYAPCPTFNPPDWDRSGVFYEDEDRPDECLPLYTLVRVSP